MAAKHLARLVSWLGMTGLRVRLFSLVVIALIPTLGMTLYTASTQRQRASLDAQDSAVRLARLAAADQEQLISSARSLLITFAQLSAIYTQDADACNQFLTKLLPEYPAYSNFGATDEEGNMFCTGLSLLNPVNLADRPYFQQAMQTHDFAIGEYAISRTNSKPAFTFGYPVFDPSGAPRGIVYAGLNLPWLNQSIASVPLPQNADLWLLDRNGTTLAQYPEGNKWMGLKMPVASVLSSIVGQQEGVIEAADTNGIRRLYAFTPVRIQEQPAVFVVIGIPDTVAFAEANKTLAQNLGALAIGAVIALAVAWASANWFILHQLDALLAATRQLSRGNLGARASKVASIGELGQLATDFNEMAQALEQRAFEQHEAQEQIRRQTFRAETLARIAGQLNAHLDPEEVFRTLCEETARALGVPITGVFLYDKPADSFYPAGGFGLPASYSEQTHTVPRTLFAEHASSNDGILAVEDVAATPHMQESDVCRSLNARSVLAATIQREEELIGCLALFTLDVHQWVEDERILLKGITQEAALAIANARLFSALAQEEHARANLLRQVITAQEDERMRIARELHDETGQSLTGLMLGLDVVHLALSGNSERADAQVDNVRSIAENMQANLRRLIADLRPALLDDLGLVSAIAWYGEQRLNPLGITLELNADSATSRLPREMETALFRIVQEAMTNVVRHAHASSVNVHMARQDGQFLLEISDDGQGFDPRTLKRSDVQGRRLGLRGMQERVTLLSGEFDLRTAPGKGTAITVRVPVRNGGLE